VERKGRAALRPGNDASGGGGRNGEMAKAPAERLWGGLAVIRCYKWRKGQAAKKKGTAGRDGGGRKNCVLRIKKPRRRRPQCISKTTDQKRVAGADK